jgi:hypothetical protein
MTGARSMRWVITGLLIGVAALSYDLGRGSAPQLLINQPSTYSQPLTTKSF